VADLSSRREISEAKESLDRLGRRSQTKRAGRKRKKRIREEEKGGSIHKPSRGDLQRLERSNSKIGTFLIRSL